MATTPGLSRRDRRARTNSESRWAQVEADARARWDRHGVPEQTRILGTIDTLQAQSKELVDAISSRITWHKAHRELNGALSHIDLEIQNIDRLLDDQRDHLDGNMPEKAEGAASAAGTAAFRTPDGE